MTKEELIEELNKLQSKWNEEMQQTDGGLYDGYSQCTHDLLEIIVRASK